MGGSIIMKKVKTLSMIVLVIMIFISIDLGINFFFSLIPEANDGIANISILYRVFGFYDDRWSRIGFFNVFKNALWITFVIFLENIILTIPPVVKKISKYMQKEV